MLARWTLKGGLWGPARVLRAWPGLLQRRALAGRKEPRRRVPSEEEKREATQLRRDLLRHNELYYGAGTPEVSDGQYDALMERLRALEQQFPQLWTPDSPTERVGHAASMQRLGSDEGQRRHRVPMLSLRSVTSRTELLQFDRDVKSRLARVLGDGRLDAALARLGLLYCLERKYDGVAVSLTYSRGRFVRAVTRGDGEVGEDITVQLRSLVSEEKLPTQVDSAMFSQQQRQRRGGEEEDWLELRAEVVMSREEFRGINDSGWLAAKADQTRKQQEQRVFHTARNLTAGLLARKVPVGELRTGAAERIVQPLSVVVYSVVTPSDLRPHTEHERTSEGLTSDSHAKRLQCVSRLGFQVDPDLGLCESIEEAADSIESGSTDAMRRDFAFDSDGFVVKVDSLFFQQALGRTARAPHWAIAFKFPPEAAETQIRSVIFQVGRSGRVTPVAELDPVRLGGVLVSRATLHNYLRVLQAGATQPGRRVRVERRGDVIPHVVPLEAAATVTDDAAQQQVLCPCVEKQPLTLLPSGELYCFAPQCRPQMEARLRHFVGRSGLDIEGFGGAAVKQLCELGLLSTLADVFNLHRHTERLAELPGWGQRKIQNLLRSIEKARRQEDPVRLLVGLGVPRVGTSTVRTILVEFRSVQTLAELANEHNEDELQRRLHNVPGVGPIVGKQISDFLRRQAPLIKRLRQLRVASVSAPFQQ